MVRLIASSIMGFLFSGCVIPIPLYLTRVDEIDGSIVDATSGTEMPGVTVRAQYRKFSKTVKTDERGHFHFDRVGRWHGAYWIAPPSQGALFPFYLNGPAPQLLSLEVSKDGYESLEVVGSRYFKPCEIGKVVGTVNVLSPIKLVKTVPDGK